MFQQVQKIQVHPCQKHNPLLNHLNNTSYSWMDLPVIARPSAAHREALAHIDQLLPPTTTTTSTTTSTSSSTISNEHDKYPDFVIINHHDSGLTAHVFFLSLKYHRLHPDYIDYRLKVQPPCPDNITRVLLVLVDVDDERVCLRELNLLCFDRSLCLMLTHSLEEAGKTIVLYKSVDIKPFDTAAIRPSASTTSDTQPSDTQPSAGPENTTEVAQLIHALQPLRFISKSDALNLLTQFESFERLCTVSPAELQLCFGMGAKKCKRLHSVLHADFQ